MFVCLLSQAQCWVSILSSHGDERHSKARPFRSVSKVTDQGTRSSLERDSRNSRYLYQQPQPAPATASIDPPGHGKRPGRSTQRIAKRQQALHRLMPGKSEHHPRRSNLDEPHLYLPDGEAVSRSMSCIVPGSSSDTRWGCLKVVIQSDKTNKDKQKLDIMH